jgi:hypothetical protein
VRGPDVQSGCNSSAAYRTTTQTYPDSDLM